MGVPRRTIKSSAGAGSVERERVREVMRSLKSPGGRVTEATRKAVESALVRAVSERAAITHEHARKAVDALFSTPGGIIPEALRNGETVSMTGFGSFYAAAGTTDTSSEVVFHPDESLSVTLDA